MRAFVEKLGQRFFLRPAHVHRFAIDDLPDIRRGVVHVSDQNCLCGADDDTGRLQPHIDPVRAEVALLSRMIFRIDKDRIVGAGGHAGFAADAD